MALFRSTRASSAKALALRLYRFRGLCVRENSQAAASVASMKMRGDIASRSFTKAVGCGLLPTAPDGSYDGRLSISAIARPMARSHSRGGFKILLPPMELFYAGRVDVLSLLSEVPMMGPNKIAVRRRQFLRVLGTGMAATMKFDASLRAASPTDTQFQPEHLKPRYRETGHVMTFYRLSRYEGGAAC